MSAHQQTAPSYRLRDVLHSFRSWPQVFRLLWTTKPSWVLALIFLNILVGAGAAVQVVLTQVVLDSISRAQGLGFGVVIGVLAVYVGFSLARQGISVLQAYLQGLFQTILSNRISEQVMTKAASLSLSQFEDAATYDMIQRAQRDASTRPYQLLEQVLSLIANVVSVLSVAVVLIAWKWWLALLLMVIPLCSMLSYVSLNRNEFETEWERAPKYRLLWYLGHLLTTDANIKEVKLFQLENVLLGRYRDLLQSFWAVDRGLQKRRARVSLFYFVIGQLAVGGALTVVMWNAYLGLLTVGSIAGYFQAVYSVQSSTEGVLRQLFAMYQNNLFVSQLFSFLEMPSDEPPRPNPCVAVPTPVEELEFRNVTFRYPGTDKNALESVSFKLRRGQTAAVVGGNGSGKSTLAKLLAGFYTPTSGVILLNGIPLQFYAQEDLRQRMAFVLQDFAEYELSARENIGFGDHSRLEQTDAIWQAAKTAGVDELIQRLPQELDTQLGRWFEGGVQLSGGQWQKLAIARAFLRGSDILVLDEPSAALDPMAERHMFDRLHLLARDRIGIFITHRYSSLQFADQIMTLDDGRLIEAGTHAALLAQGGLYARLYRQQVSSYFGADLLEQTTQVASAAGDYGGKR